MELSSSRLVSSSRVQGRESGVKADVWPRRERRRRTAAAPRDAVPGQESLLEGAEDDPESHQLDDIA